MGYMGSGKSTLAKQMACWGDYVPVDLDEELERVLGKTIAECFEQEGEHFFRLWERKVLESCVERAEGRVVIATGGGTPCFFDNMDYMNAQGKTIFLQVDAVYLCERIVGAEHRPLVRGKNREQLMAYIQEQLALRMPFYRQARCTLDADKPLSIQDLKDFL